MPLTLPTIAPLPRSKSERLSDSDPPLSARLRHLLRQLAPNPAFVFKWCGLGTLAILISTAISLSAGKGEMLRANEHARKVFNDRKTEIKRKADLALKEQADEKLFQEVSVRAITNWETWKTQFTSEADGIACAHGHDKAKTFYTITCQLGPKGKLPTHKIVCDQGGCGDPSTIPPPPPTPVEKK